MHVINICQAFSLGSVLDFEADIWYGSGDEDT